MLSEINRIITSILNKRSLDHRTCYISVSPSPPGGSEILIECSDAAVLADVEESVKKQYKSTLSGFMFVLLPDPGQEAPDHFLVVTSVADVRRTPSHTAELVTQVIYGDLVIPLKTVGDWVLVRIDDGYVGWIRSWHLKPITRGDAQDFMNRAGHRVADTVAQIYTAPSEDALPVSDAVIGTPVISQSFGMRGWREILLPDGKGGYARARALERIPQHRSISRKNLSTTGLKFLGVPYLWGGNTPKGFDCSGLVQRIYKLHGLLLPRDSDLQARFGKRKRVARLESLRTGDLLFFGKGETQITHVALYLSDGLFLHAYGQVRVGSIVTGHPLYERKLALEWRLTRDPQFR